MTPGSQNTILLGHELVLASFREDEEDDPGSFLLKEIPMSW